MGRPGSATDVERDVEFVRLLRERVGPEPMLMWDRGVNTLTWDAAFAIRLTAALEEHGLTWIEEPFEPEDLGSFRRLRAHCSTLVASGEREWNVEGYRSFIAEGVADVIGFDPGRAEGITGGRRVIELVEEAGVWFNAHAWSSAIVTAASLALSLTTPRVLVFELKAEENPMQHELVESPIGRVWRLRRGPRRAGARHRGPGVGRRALPVLTRLAAGNDNGNGCCDPCCSGRRV